MLGELLGGIPEESALEIKGVQAYWETFRDSLLQAQEQSIHPSRRRSWQSKKAALLNSELLRELRREKGTGERWKREQASKAERRNTSWAHRDAERKAKAQLGPKLAGDVKSSKKVLTHCKYVRKKDKEMIGPLLSGTGKLVTNDSGKPEDFPSYLLWLDLHKAGQPPRSRWKQ